MLRLPLRSSIRMSHALAIEKQKRYTKYNPTWKATGCRCRDSASRLTRRTKGRKLAPMENVVNSRMSMGVESLSGNRVESSQEPTAMANASSSEAMM